MAEANPEALAAERQRAAYRRYRFMAIVTGTTLLTLCAMQILNWTDYKAWHSILILVKIVGIGHGVVLYPVYFVMCFMFALRARLNLGMMALMFLAGFIPGLAFYLEHRLGTQFGYLQKRSRDESVA